MSLNLALARVRLPDGSDRWARVTGRLDDALTELELFSSAAGIDPTWFAAPPPTESRWRLGQVQLLAPSGVGKIVAVGVNYRAHAAEFGNELPSEPRIFLKPTTSLANPGQPIVLPPESDRVEHEAELAIVIGRGGRRIPRQQALEAVFGYTAANDVTARDLQRRDLQWTRAKGFDTFCPLGPVIVPAVAPGARIRASVNGQPRQDSSIDDLVFGVAEIVSFISDVMTLHPGDVILTGTPSGVGPLRPGDQVVVEVEGVGLLKNPVVAEASARS